jgi:hypothetical protein
MPDFVKSYFEISFLNLSNLIKGVIRNFNDLTIDFIDKVKLELLDFK